SHHLLHGFRRSVRLALHCYFALGHGRLGYVARDYSKDARTKAPRTLVSYQFINLSWILEIVTTFTCVPNMGHLECDFSPSVCFDVPGICLNGRFAAILIQLANSKLDISP